MEQKTVEEKIAQKVLQASLPKHDNFEPFIFNDKADKPKGWDESIIFAQEGYCSLDPRIDNSPRQKREKAISAWSYQAGYSAGIQSLQSTIYRYEKALREIESCCDPENSDYEQIWRIANDILNKD